VELLRATEREISRPTEFLRDDALFFEADALLKGGQVEAGRELMRRLARDSRVYDYAPAAEKVLREELGEGSR